MSELPVWVHIDNFRSALRGCRDPRSTPVALTMVATYAPDGVGAIVFDPKAVAGLFTRPWERLAARDVEGMRDDLLRFFTVMPDGRWSPRPEIFSANAPCGEEAA